MSKWIRSFVFLTCVQTSYVYAGAEIFYLKNYMATAEKIPNLLKESYERLVFERTNPNVKNSSMKVLGLHAVVDNKRVFQLTPRDLKEKEYVDRGQVRNLYLQQRSEALPRESKVLSGVWNELESGQASGGNILGGYGTFYAAHTGDEFIIPVIDIESDISEAVWDLAYYGAELVKEGEYIRFPEQERFPIWAMSIDAQYVRGTFHVLEECGEYLEWHSDKPHWHHAIRPGGFYILGRSLNKQNRDIRLTGFRIPKGYAVYTQGGVIHSDAHLVGKWIVGYDEAKHYSTALIKNLKFKQLRISSLMNYRSL